jgi:hypothetical protein
MRKSTALMAATSAPAAAAKADASTPAGDRLDQFEGGQAFVFSFSRLDQ